MTIYISMLRGINVAGQKKILMEDLKNLYSGLGFTDVETYIQSGNVIFTCSDYAGDDLSQIVETSLQENYGFHVPVQIRSKQEFIRAFENIPFDYIPLSESENDGTKVLITFLATIPGEDKCIELQKFVHAPEKLVIGDGVIYLYCPNGYGKTKLSNTFIEKKLQVAATTRNLKTVAKLCELVALEVK